MLCLCTPLGFILHTHLVTFLTIPDLYVQISELGALKKFLQRLEWYSRSAVILTLLFFPDQSLSSFLGIYYFEPCITFCTSYVLCSSDVIFPVILITLCDNNVLAQCNWNVYYHCASVL